MTIDEAIKIVEEHTNPESFAQYGAWQEAQRLGIEALKEAQRFRNRQPLHLPNLLPGETKD